MPLFRLYHPANPEQLLTVNEWLVTYGAHVRGVCPVCEQPARVRAQSSARTATHFSHFTEANCPTTHERHDPYRLLAGMPVDKAGAVSLRAEARFHVRELFLSCQYLATGLTPAEFRSLLREATVRRVWEYRGLSYAVLPYVLVTLTREFATIPERRTDRMYFAFPAGARRLDDLWNSPHRIQRVLWRITPRVGEVTRFPLELGHPPGEPGWASSLRDAIPT